MSADVSVIRKGVSSIRSLAAETFTGSLKAEKEAGTSAVLSVIYPVQRFLNPM